MSPRLAFLAVPLLLTLPLTPSTRANPVPDAIANDFRDLVQDTAASRACPRPESLARHFGSFGLDLLSAGHVASIEANFDVFAPLLVRSQDLDGALQFPVHHLYRRHADAAQREAMIRTLRRWLTEDIREAPRSGSMQISGPPEAVREIIEGARAAAAEMLCDWNDRDAAPLIDALLEGDLASEDARRKMTVLRARFDNPCAGRLVRPGTRGPVEPCAGREDVGSATLTRRRTSRQLTDGEIRGLLDALSRGTWEENGRAGNTDLAVTLRLKDRTAATVRVSASGLLSLSEDSSSDRRIRRVMSNEALYQMIRELSVPVAP